MFNTHKSLSNHSCTIPFTPFYTEEKISFAKISKLKNKQTLSILGETLISQKTVFYDVEPYDFYVAFEEEIMGYFCKHRENENSLSCLVVFPPFQKTGLGGLLIDLSQSIFVNIKEKVDKEKEVDNEKEEDNEKDNEKEEDNEKINGNEIPKKLYVPNGPERPLSVKATFCYRKYWQYKVIGAKTVNQIAKDENISVEDAVVGLERNGFNFKNWEMEKEIVVNKPKKMLTKKLKILLE